MCRSLLDRLRRSHDVVGRGNAPANCLAQPIGLGHGPKFRCKGQRPGHLPSRCDRSRERELSQTDGPLALKSGNGRLPSPLGWAKQISGPWVRSGEPSRFLGGTTTFCRMAIVITAICLSVSSTVADEPNNNPIREIFVPFDDLNLLLQGDAERTFLTRDEYEDLIAKAKQTPIEHAPHQLLMLSADYDTVIEEARASIRGKLWLEVLEPGLHAIPLDLNGVGIRTAMLDGKPASLGRNPTGQVILFVEGVGQRLLELDLVTILQTSAAQQSLQFALPTPTATKLHVAVPGNVEVRSGAAVVSRTVDEEANVTRFELLPQRGPLSLVMSLNNKLLLEQRVVMA